MSDRIAKPMFWCSTALLLFLYGVAVGNYQVFPFRAIQAGIRSVRQVSADLPTQSGLRPTQYLQPSTHEGQGVTLADISQMAPGMTLLVGFFDGLDGVRLVQPDGRVVRSWRPAFSTVFPSPTHLPPAKVPKSDRNAAIHGALLLPDGSLLINFNYLGLAKLDRCGAVVWSVPRMTHHSIEQASDGGFWVSAQRYVQRPSIPELGSAPFFEDTILEVSSDGTVVKEFPIIDLLLENELAGFVFARRTTEPSATHLNDVEELAPDIASRFPQFAAGDLLVSLRDLNLIFVFSPTTRKVKWYKVGGWVRQHDPDFDPDGTISIFNNNGDESNATPLFGSNTILKVDPAGGSAHLAYGGTASQRLATRDMGKHQYLPGGNLLVTEPWAGRAVEVNPKGLPVWEYINRYDEKSVAFVSQATRYAPGYFTTSTWTCP